MYVSNEDKILKTLFVFEQEFFELWKGGAFNLTTEGGIFVGEEVGFFVGVWNISNI